jgi:hypothetical protein
VALWHKVTEDMLKRNPSRIPVARRREAKKSSTRKRGGK